MSEPTVARALVVLPRAGGRSAAVDARTLAAAGLARGLAAVVGACDVLTPDGLRSVDELETGAVRARSARGGGGPGLVRALPRSVRVALGDVRAVRAAARLRARADEVSPGYVLVVAYHHRYHDAGLALARRLGVPVVHRVEALEVREERAWGIRRPGWGRLVESRGELALIRQADLVTPVSEELDAQLAEVGVRADRRVVVANGVDTDRFAPGPADDSLRRRHGLDGRLVVGWIGGFRPFHGLELVPAIAERLRSEAPDALLALVGTGPLRHDLEAVAAAHPDAVRVLPPLAHPDVPRFLRSVDIGLLLGQPGAFHYSPMKLYEYLACGLPVVAPRVGQIAAVVRDGVEGLLVPPGDAPAVAGAIARLAAEPTLRSELGRAGRARVERTGSWRAAAAAIVEALRARHLLTLDASTGREIPA